MVVPMPGAEDSFFTLVDERRAEETERHICGPPKTSKLKNSDAVFECLQNPQQPCLQAIFYVKDSDLN